MATSKRCAFLFPLLIILLLFIVSFVSILSVLFLFQQRDSHGNVQYCVPFISNCHKLDKIIRKNETNKVEEIPYLIWEQSMDPKLDPCVNFYQFSCSKYETSKLDNEEPSYLAHLSNNQTEKCFLDTFYSQKSNSSTAIQKMRRYQKEYDLTQSVSEEVNVQNLIDEINSFGSCPALSFDKKWENTGIIDMLIKMTNLTGLSYLYEIDKMEFRVEKLQPIIKPSKLIFSNPSSTLKSYYKTVSRRNKEDKMLDFFVQIFELIEKKIKETEKNEKREGSNYGDGESGIGQNDYYENYEESQGKNYMEIAQKLVNVELYLIRIYNKWNYFTSNNSTYAYHFLDRSQFKRRFGIFGIEKYLFNNSRISTDLNKHLYQNGYNVGTKAFYFQTKFTDDLSGFYRNLDTEVLANYLCLRYIFDRMPYLDEDFKQLAVKFETDFDGEVHQLLLTYNEDTKEHIESMFPLLSDHLFVTHCQSSPNQIEKVRGIVKNVLSASKKLIQNTNWLDSVSQENALNKLNSAFIVVGASEIAFNQTKLDEMYEALDFKETDGIMKMEKKLRLFNLWHSLSVLHMNGAILNFKAQKDRSTVNNAFAHLYYSLIFLPLGGLFLPSFDVNQPYSSNYGAVGRTAGHEFFHLLDADGVGYLPNGSFQSIFGDPETEAEFEERVFCLSRQYGRQQDASGLNLDGTKTMDEDIADNAGIRVGYYAYLEYLEKNGDKKVSGYSQYTHEQSFFISYATRKCAAIPLSDREFLIENGKHTLNEYRVNVPLRNFPEFSRAFNCPVGSKMNPKKKCQVW